MTRWAPWVVFVLALALRVAYIAENERVLGLDVSELPQTDNYVFAQWAARIAEGDLLCREQPHAYHLWTKEVAPEGRWLEWYGGERTYHQAPLYPYFVAAVYAATGTRDNTLVGYVQAVLGALTCALTTVLASRIVSPRAGLIAGLLLAGMGVFYFHDAFVLRDSPLALLVVVMALALDRAVSRGRTLDWLLAGASLGLFTLAKETGPALLGLALIALLVWKRHERAVLLRSGALLVLGWLLLTAPAFARNAIVGAPILKLSTRGPEVLVAGNAWGQDGVGWEPPPDELRRILMDSNFSLGKAGALSLATHRGDPWAFVRLSWNKLRAFFNAYEEPNNVNFYLHRSHLLTLKLGAVPMALLAPAALLGLLLGLRQRRRLAVVYLLLLALVASVVSLYILGRFRLHVLPLLALFAGLALDRLLLLVRGRRWAALAILAVPAALLVAWCLPEQGKHDPYTEQNKNASIMLQLAKAGNFEQAMRYWEAMRLVLESRPPEDDQISLAWKLQGVEDAFSAFEHALALPEGSAARSVALGDGYGNLMLITKRAEQQEFIDLALGSYLAALEADPQVVGAHHGMAAVHHRSEDWGRALSELNAELKLHPDHAPSRRDAGFLHLLGGRPLEALREMRAALDAGLEEPLVLATAARLHIDPELKSASLRDGGEPLPAYDPDLALRLARRALEIDDGREPLVREKCAEVLYVSGEYDEAVAILRELAAEYPQRTAELLARAEAFLKVKAAKQQQPPPEPAPVEEDAP